MKPIFIDLTDLFDIKISIILISNYVNVVKIKFANKSLTKHLNVQTATSVLHKRINMFVWCLNCVAAVEMSHKCYISTEQERKEKLKIIKKESLIQMMML